jgi:large subunit ribosomal protein L32
MAVPKRRVCHARKKLRNSQISKLTAPALSVDKKTKSIHRPHQVDLRTGLYRGKQVLFKEDDAAPAAPAADAKPEQK